MPAVRAGPSGAEGCWERKEEGEDEEEAMTERDYEEALLREAVESH